MRGFVPPDPETKVSIFQYAIVYMPRRNRKRFSCACVTIKPSREQALLAANPQNKYYPASVLGPSKSSEGQYLYYLDEWLQDDPHGD